LFLDSRRISGFAAAACLIGLSACFGISKPGADAGLLAHPEAGADAGPAGADGGNADLADGESGLHADSGLEGGVDLATDDGGDPAPDGGADNISICAQCSAYGAPQALGTISDQLPELSGLAASQRHPGLIYTHNDSGDSARFFAMDETAAITAEIHLTGATAVDWEDISVGACPGGPCVYIGDTGDNKLVRDGYVIYRVIEPAVLPTDGSIISVDYQQFPFVYPDGPHNAETLLVHPVTGQVFIITKDKDISATVFEMPLPLVPDQQVTLVPTATLLISPVDGDGIATDGAFHPCGDRLLVRTTEFLFELRRAPGDSLVSLFTSTPVKVPVADEPQGEGVTFALDGLHYFTSSETKPGGPSPSLSVVGCATP
jgi:hypothetical protein